MNEKHLDVAHTNVTPIFNSPKLNYISTIILLFLTKKMKILKWNSISFSLSKCSCLFSLSVDSKIDSQTNFLSVIIAFYHPFVTNIVLPSLAVQPYCGAWKWLINQHCLASYNYNHLHNQLFNSSFITTNQDIVTFISQHPSINRNNNSLNESLQTRHYSPKTLSFMWVFF